MQNPDTRPNPLNMAGASDKARFYLERAVPQLQEFEQKKIFTPVRLACRSPPPLPPASKKNSIADGASLGGDQNSREEEIRFRAQGPRPGFDAC